jgi:hypothetical protein
MKNILFAVYLICTAFTTTKAQNLLIKVPSTSTAVIKYSGDNFNKNMPLKKVDGYSFIKNNFFKLLNVDTLTSVQQMGIDFEKDTYQYVSMEDSAMSFVTLLHLKSVPQFLQFIKTSYGTSIKTEKKNGFEFLPVSANAYVGWNENVAIIVNTSYRSGKSYYDEYPYTSETITTTTEVVADTTFTYTDTARLAPVEETKKKNPAKKAPAKKKTTVSPKKNTTTKKSPEKTKTPMEDVEIYDEQTTTVVEAPIEDYDYKSKYYIQDSIDRMKRELWYQQQDMIAKTKQQKTAEKIMGNTFTGNIFSIENELSYKKVIDPAAHASVWFNYENFSKQYWNAYLFRSAYYMFGSMPNYIKDTTDGFKTGMNIYFDKDKMQIDQKVFSANPQIAKLGAAVMDSKQNTSFINYVNPDNIGYLSMSINTEAMANYYYTIMKSYARSYSFLSEYADLVDLYIDMLEIAIDEKGISDLMPGNFLFVMHDMKTKLVNYTDYEYDSEYNAKKVTKTKKELSPDFSFVMETKREDFMQKIANIPLKYAEKGKFNYKQKGGYYELAFSGEKYPITSLYFIVKDGKAIVTTSKDVIDMTLNNTTFSTDKDTKKSILNNNYSVKINSQKLLEKLSGEFSTDVNKEVSNYLVQNIGDIKIESNYKNDMIQSTGIMNINGKHTNSLEFLFDMIEDINNMIEKEKLQRKTD